MKKITLLSILGLMLFSCSGDDGGSGTGNNDGQGGSLASFVLKDNYLYTVDDRTINVFKLQNTEVPVKINDVNVGSRIETLFSQDNYLYVGSQTGMYIYSLQNPQNPVKISSAQHLTACDPVVSNGPVTFVTLHSNTRCGSNINVLEVYDTSNINLPSLITQVDLIQPKGLGLYGSYLFVCDAGLIKIFDVQNPETPTVVHALEIDCHDVIISGNDLFAIGDTGLFRYKLHPDDITNITSESNIIF